MDELIAQLKQITEEVTAKIDEVTFEELEQFVAERDKMITSLQAMSLQAEATAEHRQTVQSILQQDTIIMARIQALKDEASQSIHKIAQGKSQRDVYESPYSMDAIYFDKKK